MATLDAVDALGLTGATVRINDRRALEWMLETFGFDASERPGVLITIDKLDKIGPDGVIAELRERGATTAAVDAFEAFLRRPKTLEYHPYGERQIRKALPDGVSRRDRRAPGRHRRGRRGDPRCRLRTATIPLVFDPFLVRGMGYYTGTIFELAHPSVDYSLGGGGRYDGMIGRFLGQDVPAVGFSLGFERLVDLVTTPDDAHEQAVVLVHDRDMPLAELLALKAALIARGARGAARAAHQEPQGAARARGIRRLHRRSRPSRREPPPDTIELKPLG